MKKIIFLITMCLMTYSVSNAQTTEFEEAVNETIRNLQSQIPEQEKQFASMGIPVKISISYQRPAIRISYKLMSEEWFNMGNIENGANSGIESMLHALYNLDTTKQLMYEYIDELEKNNARIDFYYLYESGGNTRQKKASVYPNRIREIARQMF